jgi:hypothetical protein
VNGLSGAKLNPIRYWRIIIVWVGITLVPTAVVSWPLGRWLSDQLDYSIYAGAWARETNVTALRELMVNATEIIPFVQGGLVIAALLTLVFSPFLTGMVVASARQEQPLSFVPLIQGGVREYGRMLRTLLWSLVPLGIACAIGALSLFFVEKRAEIAILEAQASREHLAALILSFALFVVAHVSVEAGRAQFALDIGRRSAVKAWGRGVRLIFATPVPTLGSYILITAGGLILAALLGIARVNSPHATLSGFFLSLALTELIAIVTVCMRIARLLTLIQIGSHRLHDAAPRGSA